MIADPLAVLEEGEVHLGFSTDFRDSKSGFCETMLHDIDVLVARSPAHLPSDIQKVMFLDYCNPQVPIKPAVAWRRCQNLTKLLNWNVF